MKHKTYLRFKWSRLTADRSVDEWCITLENFHNKRYTYYWNNIPIKNISTPFLNGTGCHRYVVAIICTIDSTYTYVVNVEDIKDISDLRSDKINLFIN